jgi:hypothetical protein
MEKGAQMRRRQILLISLFALLICIPALSAQAQDDSQPMDDEFIDALVMMAVNHDLMAGNNELYYLQGLKSYVNDYYDTRSLDFDPGDTAAQAKLQNLRHRNMDMLEKKISQAKAPAQWLLDTLDFFTDINRITLWDPDPYVDPDEDVEQNPDDDNLPDDVQGLMNAVIWTDFEATVNVFLNINTISAIPSAAPAISDSTGWSYNVPAISDSTGAISSSGGSAASSSGNDQPPPVSSSEDSSDAQDEPRLKPIRFTNNGFEPVTVVVESYEPAPGLSAYVPGASTVVMPESNSSAYLNLPTGTYTFCYYWQLDEDYNNDDYFDYHHRTTSAYTLNVNSSDSVESAATVSLSPDSNVSNPNGKCGETNAQDDGSLTPEERANQGIHQYEVSCQGEFKDWCNGQIEILTVKVTFFEGGAEAGRAESNDPDTLVNVARNTYTWTNIDGDIWIYIFTMEGMRYYPQESDGSSYFLMTLLD